MQLVQLALDDLEHEFVRDEACEERKIRREGNKEDHELR